MRVEGRVVRVFRQGAVGSFPPLAEAWLATPAGDLFCAEFPPGEGPDQEGEAWELGRAVAFTGTFLKTIRYAAGDQARLAPLIVGDRPPAPSEKASAVEPGAASALARSGASPGTAGDGGQSPDAWSPTGRGLALVLGLAAAAVLAWRHLRGRRPVRRSGPDAVPADPPLEFVDREPVHGPAHPAARSD